MKKNAFVFLYICTAAFIIAIFVFYGSVGKQNPGGQSLYLGEKELQVFESYQEAEQDIYAIELAALLSAKQASQENFESDFKEKFGEYLKQYSLSIEDYELTFTAKEGTMMIIGKAKKLLTYQEDVYTYTVEPHFKVSVPYTQTKEESSESVFQ